MARCPLEKWSVQTNQDGLDTLASSPDGRFLAIGSGDRSFPYYQIRDLQTGRLVHHPSATGFSNPILSPDGKDFFVLWKPDADRDLLERIDRGTWEVLASSPMLVSTPFYFRRLIMDKSGSMVGTYDNTSTRGLERCRFFDAKTLRGTEEFDAINPPSNGGSQAHLLSWPRISRLNPVVPAPCLSHLPTLEKTTASRLFVGSALCLQF
jgi:hypothetical protein